MPLRQAGVVLIMALVMLTVLTLIGITSMSSSTLEMKVAGNMQQHTIAFQGALSRLAFASADDPANPIDYLIAIDVKNPPYPVQTCNADDGCINSTGWTASANVNYISCAKGFGSSLQSGKGFSYRTFEIVATGQTTALSSRSVQASAIRYPVKGCGDEML
ncbi:MAG: pilus assembly PilX N-terminal domain-containing protein [Gammaproteobacteria bacterium]|nr:pilus assembly PilX N-terminal domain-containing protein [Gammaproteobacteria bacterium]